jgi:MFS family permease
MSTIDRSDSIQPYSWYVLAVLTAVYVLNFLDRTIIYLLFTPIKKELSLSDFQLALLSTTSFVIFYTLLGIPFGRLADRVSRRVLIGAGLATWSLFSGLTGFCDGFWTLFFCRMMVGVGEATLGPAALSLLSDYFPPRVRATVQSIYACGIPIGAGLAFFLGGLIGQKFGWRPAFYYLGFPGLALAVVVFLLREVPRGRTEAAAAAPTDWKSLFRSRPLRYLFIGYALVGLPGNNLSVWGTAFFVRVHKLSLLTIGTAGLVISLVVGVPLTILGGYYADRLSRRFRGGRMAFTSMLALASVPLWLALLFVNNFPILIAVNIVLYGCAIIWVGPATADIHDLAGPNLRGIAIGIFFSIVNLVAYGLGSPLIGRLSDILGVSTNPDRMRLALLVCPVACLLGAILLWLGSKARSATQQ